MAVTQNTYTGDGSTVLFSFTFPYLETTDIKVSLNGSATTAYTLANATTIEFNTAPSNGDAIRIYRDTDDSQLNATFYPGSAIRSSDLNDNFTQNLYVTQEAINYSVEAIVTAEGAVSTANAATATANGAVSTANAATATANTAASNAAAAVSTANTASTNASAAVSTANTASTNASAAVATANSAAADAATAISTANGAVSTANSAATDAATAISTANSAAADAATAISTANGAVTTANAASTAASNAVTTADAATTTADGAVTTANTALTTANAAASAVANAILYDIVSNVAAIPGSPANNDAVEITDSTGIQSFTPLSGVPAGFTGSPGLSVRIVYTTTGSTWNWIQYFPNDPESRYLKFSGGTLTGQLLGDDSASASTPGFAFDGDPDTGIGRPGANELALITGGTARLTVDPAGAVAIGGSLSVGGQAAVVTSDSRLSDTRTPTDGSVTNAKVAANAAIAGTKISPDFGSQNITTTGTSTAASFTPTSSTVPTNGVYLPAANSVALSTNGTGRLFVDSSGRILVNLSSARDNLFNGGASSQLQIEGPASPGRIASIISNSTSIGAPPYLVLGKENSGAVGGNTAVVSNTALGTVSFQGSDGTSFVEAARIGAFATGTPGVGDMPGDLFFSTTPSGSAAPQERLRITSDGKVGIGTTSPSALLDIEGTGASNHFEATSTGNCVVRLTASNTSGCYLQMGDPDDTNRGIILYDNSSDSMSFTVNAQERARIDSSGRLLVGTSSARTDFKFGGSSATPLNQIESDGAEAALAITRNAGNTNAPTIYLGKSRGGSAGATTIVQSGDRLGSLSFNGADGSNLIQAARIDVEVDGDPDPNDDGQAENGMPGRLVFSTTADGASSPTERLRISSNGTFTGSATNDISDQRLKQNIQTITDAVAKVKALSGRTFEWKPEAKMQCGVKYGFIAQEVEAVVPELVECQTGIRMLDQDGNVIENPSEADGPCEYAKSVQSSGVVPILVEALKEALTKIETLEAKVAALETA